MINLFDFIAVDDDGKTPSQTDIKKMVNKLELKEIQDLTSHNLLSVLKAKIMVL